MYDHVQDSGQREDFSTGSVRDSRKGKGRFDLITPIAFLRLAEFAGGVERIPPVAMQRLARHYENGAVKYGERNWELGQPVSRYIDSGIRHLTKCLAGQRDEDHLAAALWNAFSATHTIMQCVNGNLHIDLCDLPFFEVPPTPSHDELEPPYGFYEAVGCAIAHYYLFLSGDKTFDNLSAVAWYCCVAILLEEGGVIIKDDRYEASEPGVVREGEDLHLRDTESVAAWEPPRDGR